MQHQHDIDEIARMELRAPQSGNLKPGQHTKTRAIKRRLATVIPGIADRNRDAFSLMLPIEITEEGACRSYGLIS